MHGRTKPSALYVYFMFFVQRTPTRIRAYISVCVCVHCKYNEAVCIKLLFSENASLRLLLALLGVIHALA